MTPKYSIRELLQLINTYKNPVALLCPHDKWTEKAIRNNTLNDRNKYKISLNSSKKKVKTLMTRILKFLKKLKTSENGNISPVHGSVALTHKNSNPAISNLQSQCNPHQNCNTILHRF